MSIPSKLFSFFIITICIYGCGSDTAKNKTTVEQGQDSLQGSDTTVIVKSDTIVKNGNLTYVQAYDRALTLWQTPFEEKDIKTSYGNAHVIVCGPAGAEPLVLLHGMNASSTMWYPNIKSLSAQYRVYAIDFLLEPGKSFCQGECTNTDEAVNWYYQIFDQLGLKKFSIVGASRGGWLALNIALHNRSRINKIALLSPAQAFIWIKPSSKIISNVTYSISPKRRKLRGVLETMTFNVDNISQLYIDQYYIATKEATTGKCILQMTPFSDDELRSLKMPVLVLIGDNDIINNDKSLERAKKLIHGVETGTIKNAGHFLSVDQSDMVDKRVLDFLNNKSNLVAKK